MCERSVKHGGYQTMAYAANYTKSAAVARHTPTTVCLYSAVLKTTGKINLC